MWLPLSCLLSCLWLTPYSHLVSSVLHLNTSLGNYFFSVGISGLSGNFFFCSFPVLPFGAPLLSRSVIRASLSVCGSLSCTPGMVRPCVPSCDKNFQMNILKIVTEPLGE